MPNESWLGLSAIFTIIVEKGKKCIVELLNPICFMAAKMAKIMTIIPHHTRFCCTQGKILVDHIFWQSKGAGSGKVVFLGGNRQRLTLSNASFS